MINIKNRFKNNNEIDNDIKSLYKHYSSLKNLMSLIKVKELSIESEIRGTNCIEELKFKKEYVNHIKKSLMIKTNGENDISELMKMILGVLSGVFIAFFTNLASNNKDGVERIVIVIVIIAICIFLFYLIVSMMASSLNDSIVERKRIFITNYYCDMYINLIDIRINQINNDKEGSV